MSWSFAPVASLARSLRRSPRAKASRRDQTPSLRLAIDQLESRRALAITSPLSIGGTTVGTFTDSPTGIGNIGDAVTVSITGTKGTVIFNGGKGVADGTDIQTIEIVNASPDFQLSFSAAVQVANPVPYGSDGIVQIGKITANNVIRGINTIRGPLTNVAAVTTPPIGFNQATAGSNTLTVEGDQTSAWPLETFVATTPLESTASVGAPSFGKINSVGYDANTGVTTIGYTGQTAAGTTAGALTAAATVQPSFVLTSFVGVNFSGGLFVDRVVGADTVVRGSNVPDLGIYLSQGLRPNASIVVRNDLDAAVLLAPIPGAAVSGRLLVGSATSASQLFVGPQTISSPLNSPLQIQSDGDFNARVIVAQAFSGIVNVGGRAGGSWLFNSGVLPNAVLNAQAWDGQTGDNPAGVSVTGAFAGRINAFENDVRLTVTGDLAPTARVNGADIYLNVKGGVLGGAVINGSDVYLTVAKNFSGTLTAEDDIEGTIGGNVSGATMTTSSDIELAITGSVINSTLSAYSQIDLDVKGSILNSKFNAIYDDLYIKVASNVTNSSFAVGSDYDLDLIVGGNMSGSTAVAYSDVTVKVTGSVTNSQFASVNSDVDLDVGGDLSQSKLSASDDDIGLKVGRDALGNTLTASGDIDATIGRNWSGVSQSGYADVIVRVGGSVLKGSSFSSGEDTYIDVKGGFNGSTTSRALQFFVGGSVLPLSRITAQRVSDWREAQSNFSVGGQFAGILNVGVFDAAPNVQTVTLIGGGAASTARFNVGRFATDTLVFKGDFLGNLQVAQDLEASLDFQGNVARVAIGGRVGSYTPDNSTQVVPVSINVAKRLTFLSSNSLFEAATPAKSGTFYSDAISSTTFPSLAATGILTTGSYGTVLPTRPGLQTLGPITPQTYAKPSAPTNFSASAGSQTNLASGGIKVSFDAPTTPGGLPVVFYQYTTDNGANWRRFSNLSQGPGTDIALPGPSGGGSTFNAGVYDVRVRAVNALGNTATTASSVTLQVPV